MYVLNTRDLESFFFPANKKQKIRAADSQSDLKTYKVLFDYYSKPESIENVVLSG